MTTFREAFPILYVDDVERAAAFYCEHLGFELQFRWPADGEAGFVFLRLEPLGIGLAARAGVWHRRPVDFELCVYVDDVDAAAERLRAADARELQPPTDQPWGERLTYFETPDGHVLHVTMPLPSVEAGGG